MGKRKYFQNLTCIIAAVMLVLLLPCVPSLAVPTDLASKSQQAAQISREIDELDRELEIATDAYNRVKTELDAITEKVDLTRQRLYEIRISLKKRRELLNSRAAEMYKNGRTTMLEVLLSTRDFADFLHRADYAARVAESDAKLIKRIRKARDSVAEIERQLAEQQRQQQALLQQVAGKKADIEAKLAARQALLSSINQEIQRILEEEARRRDAEAAALQQKATEVLVSAPESSIAKTAMRYIGVPYHWAGNGPGGCPTGEHRICFDCSGFTKYVYRLHGINIPRTAAAQFEAGIKIPLSQARPGDLVFFGMPPHHVGIYLGNDMFIHAPRTGDVVKVSRLSARSDFSGVCRYKKP